MKLDVLFFAAHPDDAELCAGGTIAKIARSGKKVGIADLTKGELGTRGSIQIRKNEAANAGKILGVSIRENLGIPDGNIENNPRNRLKVISIIRKYRPEIIFFPHYHDRHPDHRNTHILVKEGAFYSGLSKIKTKGLKQYRPKRNFYYMQTYTFEPSLIIDISDTNEIKMDAIGCYSSQFYNPAMTGPETFVSSKKFIDYIKARSQFYGFQIGAEYGEAFYTDDKIKISTDGLFKI